MYYFAKKLPLPSFQKNTQNTYVSRMCDNIHLTEIKNNEPFSICKPECKCSWRVLSTALVVYILSIRVFTYLSKIPKCSDAMISYI